MALPKIQQYCSYQERSHAEVKEKLYGFGLFKADVEELISTLIEEDYLNEERFACHFARGKFRLKNWGRVKIIYELKQKKVSAFNIKKALQEIDETEYATVLQKLVAKKWQSLKGEQYMNRQVKTMNYLLQKGFEPNVVHEAVKAIFQKPVL